MRSLAEPTARQPQPLTEPLPDVSALPPSPPPPGPPESPPPSGPPPESVRGGPTALSVPAAVPESPPEVPESVPIDASEGGTPESTGGMLESNAVPESSGIMPESVGAPPESGQLMKDSHVQAVHVRLQSKTHCVQSSAVVVQLLMLLHIPQHIEHVLPESPDEPESPKTPVSVDRPESQGPPGQVAVSGLGPAAGSGSDQESRSPAPRRIQRNRISALLRRLIGTSLREGSPSRIGRVVESHPMKLHNVLRAGAVALALASSAILLPACGNGGGSTAANVQPGDMPEGETWSGVYFHPVYGYLHMVEQDTNVVGKWKRSDQSAWGEMSGTKTGNVLHFSWKEHKYGLVGPSAESHGKGVFVYKMNSEHQAELDGQFGFDDNETGGGTWHNVKQQRMQPDLNSITGDLGGTAPPGAGKWDQK